MNFLSWPFHSCWESGLLYPARVVRETFEGLGIVALPVHWCLLLSLNFLLRCLRSDVYNVSQECHLVKMISHEVQTVVISALFGKVGKLALFILAVVWKCRTTSISFSLWGVSHKYSNTFSLEPIVTALRVVHRPFVWMWSCWCRYL